LVVAGDLDALPRAPRAQPRLLIAEAVAVVGLVLDHHGGRPLRHHRPPPGRILSPSRTGHDRLPLTLPPRAPPHGGGRARPGGPPRPRAGDGAPHRPHRGCAPALPRRDGPPRAPPRRLRLHRPARPPEGARPQPRPLAGAGP